MHDLLKKPGEHSLLLTGNVGNIEAILTVPNEVNANFIAILGHPHSLQGGTMGNKVVTTMARVFRELNIPSLRFNFRGVGQSAGVFDNGVGESEDMLLLARQLQDCFPSAQLLFAGFSFGSYVSYRAAAQLSNALLISIAPPVHHYDYHQFNRSSPWIIIQGDNDEVVPLQAVIDFVTAASSKITLIRFPETGHFFHGRLIALRDELTKQILPRVAAQ